MAWTDDARMDMLREEVAGGVKVAATIGCYAYPASSVRDWLVLIALPACRSAG